MCGRFSNALTKKKIEEQIQNLNVEIDLEPNYNISPSQNASIVISRKNRFPKLGSIPWGVLPYGREKGSLLINARAESIFEKPTFSEAIARRRCLVLADSFYEWKTIGKEKMPYRILLKKQEMMIFAGVYNMWKIGKTMHSGFVILTTEPNDEMSKIHHRAPVILQTQAEQMNWISDISTTEIMNLTKPISNNLLHIYKVSNLLNKPMNNSLDLHREIPEPPTLF